jgi:hypothetical protein
MDWSTIIPYVIENMPNLLIGGVFIYYLVMLTKQKDSLIERKDAELSELNASIRVYTIDVEKLNAVIIQLVNRLERVENEVRMKINVQE